MSITYTNRLHNPTCTINFASVKHIDYYLMVNSSLMTLGWSWKGTVTTLDPKNWRAKVPVPFLGWVTDTPGS